MRTPPKIQPISGSIHPREGEGLFNLIQERPDICRIVEVGCAYGVSSIYLAESIRDREGAELIVCDPNQENDEYKKSGFNRLQEAGISFAKLRTKGSEIDLPLLLDENGKDSFDMAFIDGWHSYDHTLLDLFYATRLVRTGGIVAVHDSNNMEGVKRAFDRMPFYPCFNLLGYIGSVGVLEKISQDNRHWSWHI